ncbi:EamA family transporter [Breoghania sp.]|uniref:DMT family transporter n=1 Tax=Breoghania sp. TaxID=2065378 RepID=UPI00260B1438|nr:EamA family transporter [Breoghania sp.]MDJ0933213.1 EamA family transporter [Breoghania sp.]
MSDVIPPRPAIAPESGRPIFAADWMSLALLYFSATAIGGRELAGHLDTFSIMFYRSVIGLVVVVSVLAVTGKFEQVRTRCLGTHFWRNLAHFTGQNLWFYAVSIITLAQLFALEFTSPIWGALLALVFLGERFTGWQVGTTIAGFIGILIVVRRGVAHVGIGEIAVLAAAIGFATNVMITKSLSRTETTLCIVFWMTLMQARMAAVMLLG